MLSHLRLCAVHTYILTRTTLYTHKGRSGNKNHPGTSEQAHLKIKQVDTLWHTLWIYKPYNHKTHIFGKKNLHPFQVVCPYCVCGPCMPVQLTESVPAAVFRHLTEQTQIYFNWYDFLDRLFLPALSLYLQTQPKVYFLKEIHWLCTDLHSILWRH